MVDSLMVMAIIASFGFWIAYYIIVSIGSMVIRVLEVKLYSLLHDRAMERALGKPHGTIQCRRSIDHGPDA